VIDFIQNQCRKKRSVVKIKNLLVVNKATKMVQVIPSRTETIRIRKA